MAVKFSEFTAKLDASVDVTEVVGYLQTGELNVRIPPANLDTTYVVSTGNAGASPTINLQGTKPNQAAAISPTTVSLTGSGATLLAGNGTTTIDFGSTAYALTSTDSVVGNNSVPVVLTGTGGNDVGTDTVTIVGTGTVQVSSATNVITIDGGSISDVNSFTNVNGTYVSAATVNTAAVGDVTTGIIDLSASDGTSDSTTRFLSKDNTWDVPSYTADTNTTYTLPVSGNAAAAVLALTPSSGAADNVTLTAGTGMTFSAITADGLTAGIIAGGVGTAEIADDAVTYDKIEGRYTALSTIASPATPQDLNAGSFSVFNITGNLNSTQTLNITNMKTGQVIDILATGASTLTLTSDDTSEIFNNLGAVVYDGTANNQIQIVCIDDTDSAAIYSYTISTYTADNTPN